MNTIVILCDTLRRDHVSAYTGGKPLNQCWSAEAPEWSVLTPNIDRLAERGTVFTQCYLGSTPCMPARRDIYTGKYEFLTRGWGSLEEEDVGQDLPSLISQAGKVSYLITDHAHLWRRGGENYHTGYTGFDFVRGTTEDPFHTDPEPDDFTYPATDSKYMEMLPHWSKSIRIRTDELEWPTAAVFDKAITWLEKNHTHEDFHLHVDCFSPHEPFDPPEDLVKLFDPKGYNVDGWWHGMEYAKWEGRMTPEQFNNGRARYAAKVIHIDRWMEKLCDTMDRLDLWDDTMLIFTTDHGTFNGDHGRTGKLQTHQFDANSHLPFIIAHPGGTGKRCDQLVQLVDIYATTLAAAGCDVPEGIHGVNLLPLLQDEPLHTRDFAIAGMFGDSVTLTDGDWALHQANREENQPLNWYGKRGSFQLTSRLGDYQNGCRPVSGTARKGPDPTWLSDKNQDPSELDNLAEEYPEKLKEMQGHLIEKINGLNLPGSCAQEQLERLELVSQGAG